MYWEAQNLPQRIEIGAITFVPLTPELLEADYAAVMRDIAMLRRWSAQDWPTPTFTREENLDDLIRHDREQQQGVALTYSVIVEDVLVGCVYVRPAVEALAIRDAAVESTRGLTGVTALGWAHDTDALTLIDSTLRFLRSEPLRLTDVWWQTNGDCLDQIEACHRLGLADQIRFAGPTTEWILSRHPR
jgi:hypothetical protein